MRESRTSGFVGGPGWATAQGYPSPECLERPVPGPASRPTGPAHLDDVSASYRFRHRLVRHNFVNWVLFASSPQQGRSVTGRR